MDTAVLTQTLQEQLHPDWCAVLSDILQHEHMQNIMTNLCQAYQQNKTIYPDCDHIMHAFHLTPLQQVKVVILGQDPYHGPGQAHGLSFSVPEDVNPPPSLRNIFTELEQDCAITKQKGDLSSWARQGVLLLNASLTVEAHKANSHQHLGWMRFTDYVIKILNKYGTHLVFILWGKFARQKATLIDASRHCIITSAHPSPFSAHHGFFGSKPFSRTNQYLAQHAIKVIDWER